MANVRQIRNRLGLSQAQLASMLDVSQALLSYSENGQRDLPLHCWQKLRLLESYLDEPGLEQDDYLESELKKSRAGMQGQYERELKELVSQRNQAKHLLNIMRTDHETSYRALQAFIPEKKLFGDLEIYGVEVTKNYQALVKKYVATDISKQQALESKIRRLEMAIAELESLLGGLE